jgi:hypothetical protein
MTPSQPALVGTWSVRRDSGLLPPGITKTIDARGVGWTRLLGIPLFRFRVRARAEGQAAELRYLALPVRDDLVLRDGQWWGRGRCFGWSFCSFWLVPRDAAARDSASSTVFSEA